MKESKLLEMKNKVEALTRVVQHLLNEITQVKDLAIGTLETIKKRILERKNLENRADDSEEIAIKRYQMYEKNIDPVINFYKETNLLKVVNGETSISEISDEISGLIEGIKG